MRRAVLPLLLLAALGPAARAATVLVEAEGFADTGGWVVDQQFMDQMGSPYLLAHGLGVPVEDAKTTVAFPAAGDYRVFVRTMDWVARWNAPGAPGKFQVAVDGKPLATTFGTEGAEWHWQKGGTVRIENKEAALALHDLTGFEGRCDAIVFTTDEAIVPPNELDEMAAFRHKALGLPDKPAEAGTFDLVVVGGGVAGTCAAVAGARLGLNVALIQDRPVLGGNSSSEVRVWIQGRTNLPPYPRLGEIVRELNTRPPRESPDVREALGDDVKLAVARGEKSLALYLNHHAYKVEMDGKRIVAVVARNVFNGQDVRFAGRIFADCTGDGTIGFLAGADYEMLGSGHMGSSNMWRVVDTGDPAPFPRIPWAIDLKDKPFPTALGQLGKWFWESGFAHDTIAEAEYIRDHNLRAMYSAWNCLRNDKDLYPTHRLEWAAFVAGKRESRRLLGDVILSKDDVKGGKEYPDGCVPSTWSIDLHYPESKQAKYFTGEEFISVANFDRFKPPYPIPYRCFYSRNITNLMMAGRDISVTHEALGTTRVQGTGGMMGEVVGRAAWICREHDTTPRGVYEKHLDELKELFAKPLSKAPIPAPSGPAAPPPPPPPFKAPGANLAPKAKVTTSGDRDPAAYPASNLTDGKTDTADNGGRWLSKAEVPNWVEFAWPEPQTAASARIVSGYNKGGAIAEPIADFALQWHDGKGWKDVPGAQVKGNTNPYWVGTFGPVTASRLRLTVTAVGIDVSRIWEIELYGPAEGK